MPGGSPAAWPHVKDIFQKIAAKVEDGSPCCDWVGENGAGHYVKMVHNGIEYGDMQLISEAYNLMKTGLGMSADQMEKAEGFARAFMGPIAMAILTPIFVVIFGLIISLILSIFLKRPAPESATPA